LLNRKSGPVHNVPETRIAWPIAGDFGSGSGYLIADKGIVAKTMDADGDLSVPAVAIIAPIAQSGKGAERKIVSQYENLKRQH
jgi:hypothetical protein